jgi:membrane peptidoglycan carboxypeptidase
VTHDDRSDDDRRYPPRGGRDVPAPRDPRYDDPPRTGGRHGADDGRPGSAYLAGPYRDGGGRSVPTGPTDHDRQYGTPPAARGPSSSGRHGASGYPRRAESGPPGAGRGPAAGQGGYGGRGPDPDSGYSGALGLGGRTPGYGGRPGYGPGGGDYDGDYDGDHVGGLYGGGYGGDPGSAAAARHALQTGANSPLAGGPGGPAGPGGPGGPGGRGPGGHRPPGGGPSGGRRRLKKALKIGGLAVAVLILLGIGTVGLIYVRTDVPDPNALKTDQIATMYYADGRTVLDRVGSTNRTDVPLTKVPDYVRNAVLAAENRSFYTDPGISPTGIARAALNNVKGGDLQGGSTITQQYVKNQFTNGDRTFSRKFRELFVTVKLDKQYSKDQILEWYLNTIYFGRGAYGIEAAAQVYFGRSVDKLTLGQGAVLASSIRSPALYDPQAHPSAAKARWKFVLDGMVAMGKLTQAEEAKTKYPTVRKKATSTLDDVRKTWAGHIEDQVLDELDQAGFSQARLNQEGLRVITTIDKKAQDAAVSAVKDTFADQKSPDPTKQLRQALVAVQPQSGNVLAYYGGPNGLGTDYAQSWRQAGSAFKPYVLATALSQTLSPETPDDKKISVYKTYDGSSPQTFAGTEVANSEGAQCNPCPVLDAMRRSINTVFYKMGMDAGPANVAETAHRMGIPAQRPDGVKTLQEKDGTTQAGISIGQYEVRTIDQAQGYGVLATGGTLHPAHFVAKVVDSGGRTVYQNDDKAKQVLDSKVANDVTYSMEPVAEASLDALADGRESAAKTGTQQYLDTGGNSDAWMVGFTPKVSAAVWVGTDKPQAMTTVQGNQVYGRTLPGGTWQKFMDRYLAGTPADELTDEVKVNPQFRPAPTITEAAPSPEPTQSPQPRRTRHHRKTPPPTPTPSPTGSDPSQPTPTPSEPTPTESPSPTRSGRPGPPLPSTP